MPDRIEMDDVDRRILFELQCDARHLTNAEISEQVGVSATTVGQRIDNLQDAGVIQGYHTSLDYEKAGFPHHVLLLCTVPPTNRFEATENIIDIRGVVRVQELIKGEQNIHVEIVGRTREEIVETIGAIEESGIDVAGSEMVKTEHLQPFDDLLDSIPE